MPGLLDYFFAPGRAMMAQPPQTQGLGLLGSIHRAIDPVKAFGGYGGLLAMALPPGAAKKPAIQPISIHDMHGGEMFGTKSVVDAAGEPLSKADLSIWGDTIWVKNIRTAAEHGRKGYAKALIDDLFREMPNYRVQLSNMTPEGSGFFGKNYQIDPEGYITPKK
jgi:hypothetical protein